MTRQRRINGLDPRLLREFARGYLHQDALLEYGSAIKAAKAYVADLNPTARGQAAAEALWLRKTMTEFSIGDSNAVFAKLGAAVRFKSKEEVDRVLEVLAEGADSRSEDRSE